jgi:hypothetical protein
MNRRVCLILLLGLGGTAEAATKPKKFAFKIRTKDGNIVGNVLIEGHDVDAAKVKLFKRYPGCTILRVDEK